jgi:preprotein translocase SecE subunit
MSYGISRSAMVTYQRFIYLVFLSTGAVAGLTVKSASVAAFALLGRPDSLMGGLVPLSTGISLLVGGAIFVALLRNTEAVIFTDESITELAKVVWPGRDETTNSTMVVIVSTLILAGSLAFFDFVWARVTETFLYT